MDRVEVAVNVAMMSYGDWRKFQSEMFPRLVGKLICVTAEPRTFEFDGTPLKAGSGSAYQIHTFWLPNSPELMDVICVPSIQTLKEIVDEFSVDPEFIVLCIVGFAGETKTKLEKAVMSGIFSKVIEILESKTKHNH